MNDLHGTMNSNEALAAFGDVVDRVSKGHETGSGDPGIQTSALSVSGSRVVWPSSFDVTGLAVGAVANATLAAARLWELRNDLGTTPRVFVDSRAACAAFALESRFEPIGWERPPIWDPIAGNYQTANGWIRLHTNYASHRSAVEEVLGAHDRAGVQAAVAAMDSNELEDAVVDNGGAAAAMRTREQWLGSEAGSATAAPTALATTWARAVAAPKWSGGGAQPFRGVRVVDLTRVIAGPTCTRFLAGYGADVVRVDPRGFEEVTSLLPETTLGKRCAALDLRSPDDRIAFEELVAGADVLVCGFRAAALERLGYGRDRLRTLNPDLIIARENAYGWEGPWVDRRGFDSLVQMSCGIADRERASDGAPGALPVQALDHATGWLLGAAVAQALTQRLVDGRVATIHASLVGMANLLWSLPVPDVEAAPTSLDEIPPVERSTHWGPARVVGPAAGLDGAPQTWAYEAGPLGRHQPRWSN